MTVPSSRAGRPLAAALVAAPLLYLVSELIVPRNYVEDKPAAELAMLAEHHYAFLAAALLDFTTMVLFAAAVPAVVRLVRGRGRVFIRIAGTMVFLGTMGLAAHAMFALSDLDLAANPQRDAMAAASEVISSGTAAILILVLRLFAFDLGLTLLTIAAWRARLISVWAAPFGFLALVGDFSPGNYNGILWAIASTAAFGMIALSLLRRSESAELPAPAMLSANA